MPTIKGPITARVFCDALGLSGSERNRAASLFSEASGTDGRLSKADLAKLPDDLRQAWSDFQSQPRPSAPPTSGHVFANRVEIEAAERSGNLGVISDIDKTILPPHDDEALGAPYPGMKTLLDRIEASGDGKLGDTFYVTARDEGRAAPIPAWMAKERLPGGPIATGVGGEPWLSHPEKVSDIEGILAARPGQRFILFGDDNHTDPYVYRDILRAHPDRIAAAVIKRHKGKDLSRIPELIIVDDYAEAAAALLKRGLLTPDDAEAVLRAAQSEGLALNEEQIAAYLR